MSTSASMSRPARKDVVQNRTALLHAAREVLAEQGLEAPLDLIAERAGVGRATLYRQFPDREAILLALLERSTELLQAQALAVQERPDAFFVLLGYLSERIVRSDR